MSEETKNNTVEKTNINPNESVDSLDNKDNLGQDKTTSVPENQVTNVVEHKGDESKKVEQHTDLEKDDSTDKDEEVGTSPAKENISSLPGLKQVLTGEKDDQSEVEGTNNSASNDHAFLRQSVPAHLSTPLPGREFLAQSTPVFGNVQHDADPEQYLLSKGESSAVHLLADVFRRADKNGSYSSVSLY